ncbi:MAG: hypothetical protein WC806_02990 [Candidatus Gracilibacteria bacterium]|jgi:hypothetical protein
MEEREVLETKILQFAELQEGFEYVLAKNFKITFGAYNTEKIEVLAGSRIKFIMSGSTDGSVKVIINEPNILLQVRSSVYGQPLFRSIEVEC